VVTGRPGWTQLDGIRVHSVEWGPPDADRTVLLVHGLGAHTLSWEPVGASLAEQLDATVLAIDLVGFGRTRAPHRVATVQNQASLVTALLAERGPALVAGNSMGGAIATRVAAQRPDLVNALVLVNPAVRHPKPTIEDWRRVAWLAPLVVPIFGAWFVRTRARRLGPARLVDDSLAAVLSRTGAIDPDLRRRMVDLCAERVTWPEVAAAYADAARSLCLYLARAHDDDLAGVARRCPTLLVHGTEDRLVPVEAARRTADVHGIDLELIDGVGHAPQLETPARFVSVITDWLATVAA
jgi:pimeloyl-ACP methyl ester carboxylesterase